MTRRPSIPFTHGVHEDVCALVGERAALIFNRIAYYIEYNALDGQHEHDGRYFARVTVPDLLTVFHWLNKDKVRYAISTLIDAGLLCVPEDENGDELNLSALGWRRGKWFGHGPKSPINPQGEKVHHASGKNPPSKVKKFTFEGGKSSPAIGDTSSYPITQDISLSARGRLKPDLPSVEFLEVVQDAWNRMANASGFPRLERMTQDRMRLIRTRLADCDGDETMLLQVIDRVPLMLGWRGGGRRDHITFDWVHGPPTQGRPDRFISALEYNPDLEKPDDRIDRPQRKSPQRTATETARAARAELLGEMDGMEPGHDYSGADVAEAGDLPRLQYRTG
ncbi:MAG: hypothetical protein WBF53_13835 [Litorimonas sp.]